MPKQDNSQMLKWQNVTKDHARIPQAGDLVMIKMRPWDNVDCHQNFIGGAVSEVSNVSVVLEINFCGDENRFRIPWNQIDSITIIPKP